MKRWGWIVLGILAVAVLVPMAMVLILINPSNVLGMSGAKSKFEDYFLNSPEQVRNLKVKDESGIDTHLTMTFELNEPLRYKPTPELRHLEGAAARKQIGGFTECREAVTASSVIELDDNASSAEATGMRGRLIVQNGTQYCVFIWNY